MGRALTDPLPLRRSTESASFVDAATIPIVYGRVTISPQRYDPSGYLWLLADHPIEAIEAVELEGAEITGWRLANGTDDAGNGVAVLETSVQVESADDLAVRVRGKMRPDTGALIEAPHEILWDLAVNVCGLDLDLADFDRLRSEAADISLTAGGVVSDDSLSIQGQLDDIAQGCGVAWSWSARELAFLWPADLDENPRATVNQSNTARITSVTRAADLATRLVVEYGYDWARGDHRGAVILEAPEGIADYGRIERVVQASWLQSGRQAEILGRRILSRIARPLYQITIQRDGTSVMVGDTLSIDHPYCPVSAALVTATTTGLVAQTMRVEAPYGDAPTVNVVAHTSGLAADPLAGPSYEYGGGLVTVQVLLPNSTNPAIGARVQVDKADWLIADSGGYIQFPADPGQHELFISPIGGDTEPYTLGFTVA